MSITKNVVIAAAGMGTRLSLGKPKSLISVNGKTILEYQLSLLKEVENIFLVIGFCEENVMEFAHKIRKDIIFVRNPNFQHTKTLESFYLAAKIIDDSAVFMDGDMIMEPNSFTEFLAAAGQRDKEMLIAVSKRLTNDPVYCKVIKNGETLKVLGFSYEEKTSYEWSNVVALPANQMHSGKTHTFEYLKKFLPVEAKVIDRLEIDTADDLSYAEKFLESVKWF